MKRQTDPYGNQGDEEVKKRMKQDNQFAVLYFSSSLIVLIQVYNWEIRHHSLVCCCGFADILNILVSIVNVAF